MAKIVEVNKGYQIQLTLQNNFINRYSFKNLVNHPQVEGFYINYSNPGSFSFPFTFPSFHVQYDGEFLQTFLKLMKELLSSFGINPDVHLDPLLFIANSYQHNEGQRQIEKHFVNRTKVNGKLLVELLRMPFAYITRDNIFNQLPEFEEEAYLSAYLGVLSGKPEKFFHSNDGEVDLSLINDSLFEKLSCRIKEDNNIVIEFEEGKRLVFSKDIQLKFHSYVDKASRVGTPFQNLQNIQLIKFLLDHLINEEKVNDTELYRLNISC